MDEKTHMERRKTSLTMTNVQMVRAKLHAVNPAPKSFSKLTPTKTASIKNPARASKDDREYPRPIPKY